jgi:hypothetical protein
MIVKKELMTLTEAQAKTNLRPDVHAWHALWHTPVFLGWQDRSIKLPEEVTLKAESLDSSR